MGVFEAFRKALEVVGVVRKTDFDSKLDISLSTLRDDLRGVDNRTLTDLYNFLNTTLKTKVKEAIDEILLDEEHQIVNKLTFADYGINALWGSSGTAVGADTTETVLSVSGKGALLFVRFLTKYNEMMIRPYLDGTGIMAGGCEEPKWLYQTYGQVGFYRFIDFVMYDTANNKYIMELHTYKLGGGKFSTSCEVKVYNPDTANAHEAHVTVHYYTLASKQFKAVVNQQFDPLQLRQTICNKAKVPMSYVTVELSTQFNEQLNRNETVVSVMEHVKSKDLEKAIKEVLCQYFGISEDKIEVTEY